MGNDPLDFEWIELVALDTESTITFQALHKAADRLIGTNGKEGRTSS